MYKYIGWITLLGFASACANIRDISGGEEDKSPPIILDKSSPNQQTNFKPKEIRLYFNEWIKLDNPSAQVTISPSTEFPLQSKLKGKSVIISFHKNEQLKDNNTYTIQFGEAIKDITASNILKNFRYIFSTGDYLDSLRVRGKVVDAFTGEAREKIIVGLYENLSDTAFIKVKPFYYTTTVSEGFFEMTNLKASTFHVFALTDKNQNYFYDLPNESFAFQDSAIQLGRLQDSQSIELTNEIRLRLSTLEKPLEISNHKIIPGKLRLLYNAKPYSFEIENSETKKSFHILLQDSLLFWYQSDTMVSIIVTSNGRKDTFSLPPFSEPMYSKATAFSLFKSNVQPKELPGIIWTEPIGQVDTDKLKVKVDTGFVPFTVISDSLDQRKIFILHDKAEFKKLELFLLDSFVKGWHSSISMADTFTFLPIKKEQMARVKIVLQTLKSGEQYIFQILNNKFIIKEEIFTTALDSHALNYTDMLPGKYSVRLIWDKNRNRNWDSGDYSIKRQPEQVWNWEMQELRADWDIEITFKP